MLPGSTPNPLRRTQACLLLLTLVAALFGAAAVAAEEGSGTAPSPQLNEARIEALNEARIQARIKDARKAAESDTTLDESQKQQVRELFEQAAQWLRQLEESQADLARLRTLVSEAPERIESIRTGRVAAAGELSDVEAVLQEGTPEALERALANEQLAIQQARETHKTQEGELSRLLVGSKVLSEEIATRSAALEQIDKELQAAPTDDPASLLQAQNLMLESRRQLRQSELELFKLRLGNHELLTNLAQAERDLAAAEIAQRKERLGVLGRAAQDAREAQAREARERAEGLAEQTGDLPGALRAVIRDNSDYRQELEAQVSREQKVTRELHQLRLDLDEIKEDFERSRRRVEVVGATEVIGKMLQRRRDGLPSPQSYRRVAADRAVEIDRVIDRQIEIDELLRERGDIPKVVATVLGFLPEDQRAEYEERAEELVRVRRDALNELQKVYGRYVGQLTALDLAQRRLVEVAGAYIDYIDDQLIWIRGPGLSALVDPVVLGKGVFWLLQPVHWMELVRDAAAAVEKWPAALVVLPALFLLLLKKRQGALNRLREISKETRRIRTDSFRLTLKALYHTLISVGAWPLLLIGSGWLLGAPASAAPFTLALANGLVKAGLVLLSVGFLIRMCRPDGVGDRHLRWRRPVREALARELGWVLYFGVVLGFLVAVTSGNEIPAVAQNVGRLAFILLMAVSVVFLFRLLRRRGAMMQTLQGSEDDRVLVQLHFLWFPLLLLLPVAFAVGSALGYHYTVLHLEQRAEQTFWFFVGLYLLRELLLRSLYVAERRLRFEEAVRRRDELRAQRAQGEDEQEEAASPISLEVPELDFHQLGEQTKRLLKTGFLFGGVIGIWSIWSDLLPALGFLYSTELPLHASRVVDGIAKEVPVTLGDITLGLIMLLITVLAAKNIPGVLEIALLQRLPLDSGARYAITALTQYAIVGIGVIVAFGTLGLQWSSIQWLVAALGVGLGFGLQEIVANFISGIILLFERPIRVGDTVTIDTTTGVVSRIRIRATTIINYEKQELLIPNKEFITGRVINWTLSDKVNRVIVTVGVAYGSDVQRAMELMLEAAAENDNILEEPKPIASFEAFGDNALTLLLRAYLGSMDDRLATITALHQAINDKFATAGLEISFPQRDIHLDTAGPIDIRLQRATAAGKVGGEISGP